MASEKPDHQEKVISGSAKKVKKNGLEKMADVFVEEDLKSVKQSVLRENVIPGTKELIANTLHNAIDLIFFGESNHRQARKRNGYTSYSQIFTSKNAANGGVTNKPRRNRHSYQEISVETRDEANDILEALADQIETYGIASVADLYEFAGLDTDWTDNDYGWEDITEASVIRRSHDEYVIRMPRPIPIK